MVWQLTALVLIFMKRNVAYGAAVIHTDSEGEAHAMMDDDDSVFQGST